ncbi:unnamed protein product [Amoebophrya sp. A120]|nr:unnamed protein product [Amoebophrya sp. A120]|eukprot:GSA120T00003622001.1
MSGAGAAAARVGFDQAGKSLYRRILRLHRNLPHPMMRAIGDVYVKKEFRIHCGPPSMQTNPVLPEQFKDFLRKWNQYADQIAEGQVGKQISRQQKQTMTAEQQLKLRELREAIRGGGPLPGFGPPPGGGGGGSG